MTPIDLPTAGPKWTVLSSHRAWLLQQADNLFSFFERRSLNRLGGFHELDMEVRGALHDDSPVFIRMIVDIKFKLPGSFSTLLT